MHVKHNPAVTTLLPTAATTPAKGKEHSPAHRARALIAENAELQGRPFGKIVSALARGLPVEGLTPPAPETPPATDTPTTDTPPVDVTA